MATNREDDDLLDLVRFTYHLRARTGHQTLSSITEEKEEMVGRKISIVPDIMNWI